MGAYILRRLLLIIPTLLGIMIINFALTQFVPGGPIEQTLARFQGEGDVFSSFSGDGGGNENAEETFGSDSDYIGARGLPKEFIETLEVEFGFARIVHCHLTAAFRIGARHFPLKSIQSLRKLRPLCDQAVKRRH